MEIFKPSTHRAPRKAPSKDVYHELGILTERTSNIVIATRRGYKVKVVEKLSQALETTQSEILPAINLTSATFARRRKEKQRLSQAESNNVYRIASVYRAAVELFEGDYKAATHWLKRPVKALGNVAPLSLLDSQAGADLVKDVIGRLDTGVYS